MIFKVIRFKEFLKCKEKIRLFYLGWFLIVLIEINKILMKFLERKYYLYCIFEKIEEYKSSFFIV